MRNVAGLALFAFGAWLAWSAFAQRRRVLAARRAGAAPAETPGNPQLAIMGEIMRPIILFALVYLALKSVFAYVVLDAGRWLSYFDLAGFLFLLAAYGGWVVVRTRYREIAVPAPVAVVPAPPSASAMQQVATRLPETVA